MSKNALASLTANYTDSENEDDQADENAADEDSNESQVTKLTKQKCNRNAKKILKK